MTATTSDAHLDPKAFTEDNQALFKILTKRPSLAWPTLGLMITSILIFAGSISAYLQGEISLMLAITLNTIASYMAFTVSHDASHNALSSNKQLNDWCGRIGTLMLSPVCFFRMFRYVHMQHHRFANEVGKDPDMYCGKGQKWTLPLRWATLDLNYFCIYLRPSIFSNRPKSEQRELVLAVAWGVIVISTVVTMGWVENYLLLFLLPTRIAIVFLAFAFDFLPHYPHQEDGTNHPYQATLNRVGLEWLLTPVFLSQNYHLVHHLYPTVPFYRYLKVWRARLGFHQAQNPAHTSPFGLGPSI